MTLLDAHLDQIELCASTISDLPFPPPKKFTNAMLFTPDITTLIRDTEAHERALFSLKAASDDVPKPKGATGRRTTVFHHGEEQCRPQYTFSAPRKGTAVAAVLGGELSSQLRQEYEKDARSREIERKGQKDHIDVEVLLKGAERLCSVYHIAGATERIASLRNRNEKVLASLKYYETLVAEQNAQLGRMNRSLSSGIEDEGLDDLNADERAIESNETDLPQTHDDMKKEEQDIAELERKKKALEERVSGMDRDLGGLMR